jgi:hypothetical protein
MLYTTNKVYFLEKIITIRAYDIDHLSILTVWSVEIGGIAGLTTHQDWMKQFRR